MHLHYSKYAVFSVFIFGLMIQLTFAGQTIGNLDEIVQRKGKPVEEGIQTRPVKIAFATPLKQVSDYWRRSIDSFKGRMDEIGLRYEIREFSTRSDEKRKLKEGIRSAMTTKPDYLVLTLNASGDIEVISRLLASRTVKVIVQNMTIPLDEWKENPPFMYVGFGHKEGAKLIAGEYKNLFRNRTGVDYAMLYHVRGGKVSELRGDYFNELMTDSNCSLVAEYYTGGIRNKAKNVALKILARHPDLEFIHACATDVAFGALDALKSSGLTGKVVVNGWGGGAGELASLSEGQLDFTVMRMNDDNGVAMAEAIRSDIVSEIKSFPVIYSGKMVIVRRGISKTALEDLKQKAFRYSGNG